MTTAALPTTATAAGPIGSAIAGNDRRRKRSGRRFRRSYASISSVVSVAAGKRCCRWSPMAAEAHLSTIVQGASATDVQVVNVTGSTSGSFTLAFNGQTTGAIPAGSGPATVQNATQSLSSLGGVGANNVLVTSSNGNYYVEFVGTFVGQEQRRLAHDCQRSQRRGRGRGPGERLRRRRSTAYGDRHHGHIYTEFSGQNIPPCPSAPARSPSRRH